MNSKMKDMLMSRLMETMPEPPSEINKEGALSFLISVICHEEKAFLRGETIMLVTKKGIMFVPKESLVKNIFEL